MPVLHVSVTSPLPPQESHSTTDRFRVSASQELADAAAGTVSAVTLNIWGPGSGWNYTIMPDGTGSRVEVTAVRIRYGIKGKLAGLWLGLFGRRMITSSTTTALAAR